MVRVDYDIRFFDLLIVILLGGLDVQFMQNIFFQK